MHIGTLNHLLNCLIQKHLAYSFSNKSRHCCVLHATAASAAVPLFGNIEKKNDNNCLKHKLHVYLTVVQKLFHAWKNQRSLNISTKKTYAPRELSNPSSEICLHVRA